jgi:arylamine N-acetyltransferase
MEYGTGGTCFSLTHFYRQVLENAGYDLYTVLCDRSYGADTHCAMIVRLCGKRYLVDPGYLLEAPLLVPEREESVQSSKSSTVKLRRLGDTNQLLLITERGGKAKIRYRLKDVPVTDELYHKKWIESFEWPMMRHMSVSRQTEDGLLFMRDGKMRLYEADGDRRAIIKGDLSGELKRHFGIDPRIASDAGDCVKMFKGSYGK